MTDVLVIGAGPAGMSAALDLQARGFSVTVVDDQPAPGGRIFAAIETREAKTAEEQGGAALVTRFRHGGGDYLPSTEVWQIEGGPRVFLSSGGEARMLEPAFVVFATGAQERPMPFPGWQLPGVMTVGAAQILLKTARQIPDRPVWLAGSGPLLLLYIQQLVDAGGEVAGVIDTTPPGRAVAAAPHLLGALRYGAADLIRGLNWLLPRSRRRIIRGVVALEALGSERLTGVRYKTRGGRTGEIPTEHLLVHDGVIPGVHATLAAGCEHQWNVSQRAFEPVTDGYGATSKPSIFVAGDAATIGGARMAPVSGRLAAIGVARAAGKLSPREAEAEAAPLRRTLANNARFRRFLDAAFPGMTLGIPDSTMVCRCEEVTAGQVRTALRDRPHLGPDGVKATTRAGMGPCQGRQCAPTLSRLTAETHQLPFGAVGFLKIRPPLKPLTLKELASLETDA
ncbi:sarcosine oxidase, subunit alpha [Phenylobacterium zucineum HLK1]|uniref:Sarcosine oxidase, subunit alpha n=1 Tax=Phenylobacterium zucineum (strain HLK1) TaxID=450851 RepID=B4RFX1_PHEZH|nr:NAD(P)/FAD-dependent oxidoreductase [Phenylobacterium zucineum]ACG78784.1 sarcosine oxidase, subunit alpha [Phenylobacterium zucineum HLK1]